MRAAAHTHNYSAHGDAAVMPHMLAGHRLAAATLATVLLSIYKLCGAPDPLHLAAMDPP